MDRTKTGALIAAARKEQNMTQKELAAALHVSDRAVSKWERGAGFPDISLLEPLADTLGLGVLDLLRGERGTVPEPEPTIRQALAFLARQAKERTRRKWSQVLGGTCALLMAGFVLFAILDRAGVFLQEISLEVPATVYSAEGVSAGETTVAIDGSVKILGDRSFEGQFAIHEVETTCREGVHANIRWDAMWTDAQDILFYRELGLDLASIRTILDDPAFDRQAALQSHLAELEARRARLDDLILTVQRTINDIKGGTKMTDQEKFEAFKRRTVEANETAFGQEIREKYGDEEMDRANACVLALTQEEYAQWKSLGGEIHTALVTAVKAGADPAGPEGQRIAALHRRWLSYSWESYTPQAHVGLAELYVSDPRFTAYYDREVSGCAAFLRDAILAYTKH